MWNWTLFIFTKPKNINYEKQNIKFDEIFMCSNTYLVNFKVDDENLTPTTAFIIFWDSLMF